jgi:hypothetical protein
MTNQRTLIDANLQVVTALPAAGASALSTSLDTYGDNPGRIPDVEIFLSVPATPSLVDAKTIIYTLQDSADNSSFATVADAPSYTSTGAGGVGAAALAKQFKVPIGTRRYLKMNAAVLAAGGDNTAISFTWGMIF